MRQLSIIPTPPPPRQNAAEQKIAGDIRAAVDRKAGAPLPHAKSAATLRAEIGEAHRRGSISGKFAAWTFSAVIHVAILVILAAVIGCAGGPRGRPRIDLEGDPDTRRKLFGVFEGY